MRRRLTARRAFLLAAVNVMAAGCAGWTGLVRRAGQIPATPTAPAASIPSLTPTDLAPLPTLPQTETPQPAPVLLEAPSCTAAAGAPVPRAEWGAVEPAVFPDGWGENGPYSAANHSGWLVYDLPLDQIYHTVIIHHSALPLSDGPREIQELHMTEKQFADVGYHFLVDDAGRLFEGRSLSVRGAHTYAHNYGTIGICLIGNFEEIQPSQAQIEMLQALIACLRGAFPALRLLAGHRDYNPGVTLCPGHNLAVLLQALADRAGLEYAGTG